MILLRVSYKVRTHQASRFEEIFAEQVRPLISKHGLAFRGIWKTMVGDVGEYMEIWEFENLMEFEQKWGALMQDPEMVLADEPVASLDPVLAHSIMQYLELINDEDGVTVLCSLHFLDLVHAYADKAIALKDGRLVFEGQPSEIDDDKFQEIYGKEAERIG